MGRAWTGHAVEDACPCAQAECGLAVPDGSAPGSCPEHNPADPLAGKTMRQMHTDVQCPGRISA
jgi:hypothetical protein